MPVTNVRAPDGTLVPVRHPEGATDEEIIAYAKKNYTVQAQPAQAEPPKPASVSAGKTLMDIPRQVGLTARYALEGAPQVVDLLSTPIRMASNAAGLPMGTLSDTGKKVADWVGLPSPQTADERVVGDATRMVAGAVPLAKGADLLARGTTGLAKAVAGKFAEGPVTQITSAAGSGAAGSAVKEAGGGEWQQLAASVLGGLTAPLGASAVEGMANAMRKIAASKLIDGTQIDGVLRLELGKAGVNWDDLGAQVKLQLRNDAKGVIYSGQPLNQDGLRRLADFRSIGATPQLGDVTQNPRILTQQRNLSKQLANSNQMPGVASLPDIDNANAQRVIGTVEGLAKSPADSYATGSGIINSVLSKDASMQAAERALYGQARAMSGGDIPLRSGDLTANIYKALDADLKTPFLPDSIKSVLDKITKGEMPLDVRTLDVLKTTIATAQRSTQDGNVKQALSIIRDQIDNTPLTPDKRAFGGNQVVTPGAAQAMRQADAAPDALMQKLNEARSAAFDRRNWQRSASFIEDALNDAKPDDFVKKHVINAPVDELSKLRASIQSPELIAAVKKQMTDYIMQRGRVDSDTVKFSSAGMNDALKSLGDRKLKLFFSDEEIQQLKAAINVARYMQSQPIGSAVNNSNTGALMLGRLSDMLAKASPIPVLGPMVSQPLQGGLLQLQARQMRNVTPGLLAMQPQPAPSLIGPAALYGGLLASPFTPKVNEDKRD